MIVTIEWLKDYVDVDESPEELAERLTQSLEQPYLIGKEKLVCSAAIGLALYPEHANTLTGLLRAAGSDLVEGGAAPEPSAAHGDQFAHAASAPAQDDPRRVGL